MLDGTEYTKSKSSQQGDSIHISFNLLLKQTRIYIFLENNSVHNRITYLVHYVDAITCTGSIS
jgi:hypothetical protein